MRVAFFHGLESPAKSDKTEYLEDTFDFVYAPPMDYKNPNLFNEVYKEIQSQKFDLLLGSSMGGWFAYNLSTLTGIRSILFNPAVHSRSFDPNVRHGNIKSKQIIVLGKNDDVIDPNKTIEWFKKDGIGSFVFKFENNNHRTPVEVFSKYVKTGMNESHVKLFEEWLYNNK